jgi:hypothetical protein
MGQDRLILDQITIAMLHVITSMGQGQEVTHIIQTEANIEVIHDQGHDQGQGDIIKGNIHILRIYYTINLNVYYLFYMFFNASHFKKPLW